MPTNLSSAAHTKEMILSYIRMKGPSLPITIARDVKTSTLFASAFLSELYQERKVKMSHLKVGSTSLYLLDGQEKMLENFVQYLNRKEQEAFHLIKQYGSLDEASLHPAIRVAIKEIKDFAYPVQENQRTVWKYAYLPENDQNKILHQQTQVPITVAQALNPNIAASIQQAVQAQIIQQEKEEQQKQDPVQQIIHEKNEELPIEVKEKVEPVKEKKKITSKIQLATNLTFSLTEPAKEPIKEETQFGKRVREYCKNKDISITSIIEETKKDFTATLQIPTPLGSHHFHCIAKDKKKINESDIQLALQKAQSLRMPVLLLITAPLDKKGSSMIESWQNLIKVDKLK